MRTGRGRAARPAPGEAVGAAGRGPGGPLPAEPVRRARAVEELAVQAVLAVRQSPPPRTAQCDASHIRVWFTIQPSRSELVEHCARQAMPDVRARTQGSLPASASWGPARRSCAQRAGRCARRAARRGAARTPATGARRGSGRGRARCVGGDAPQRGQVDQSVAHVGGEPRRAARVLGQDLAARVGVSGEVERASAASAARCPPRNRALAGGPTVGSRRARGPRGARDPATPSTRRRPASSGRGWRPGACGCVHVREATVAGAWGERGCAARGVDGGDGDRVRSRTCALPAATVRVRSIRHRRPCGRGSCRWASTAAAGTRSTAREGVRCRTLRDRLVRTARRAGAAGPRGRVTACR
jgi:hypothetical protein